MRTSFGLQLFKDFGDAVQHFLDFASKGSEFVPRPHESISSGHEVFGDRYKDFFAFNVLPVRLEARSSVCVQVVIFFSSVVAVLYHLGIIQAIFVRRWHDITCSSWQDRLAHAKGDGHLLLPRGGHEIHFEFCLGCL